MDGGGTAEIVSHQPLGLFTLLQYYSFGIWRSSPVMEVHGSLSQCVSFSLIDVGSVLNAYVVGTAKSAEFHKASVLAVFPRCFGFSAASPVSLEARKSIQKRRQEPTCARVTFMGKFKKVEITEDQELARTSMFKRHPKMAAWSTMSDHDFTLYELQIEEIHLLDYFGGAKQVKPADYFNAQLDTQQGDAPNPSTAQGNGNGNNITMGGVWVGAMAGSACGVSFVAFLALGYMMYMRRDKPYTLASCEL
eukprot:984637-Pelagomonas_calceolata.AAC.3